MCMCVTMYGVVCCRMVVFVTYLQSVVCIVPGTFYGLMIVLNMGTVVHILEESYKGTCIAMQYLINVQLCAVCAMYLIFIS